MNIKKHIPNILTLGNLMSGIIAIKLGFSESYYLAGIFVLLGAVFDFFDGFVARLLGVQGEIGKQLDSLADMVTFGVAPGVVMYSFLYDILSYNFITNSDILGFYLPIKYELIAFIAYLIPLLSAVRLAKFNIDTNQNDKFIGLPTPANALFFVSIPFSFFSFAGFTHNLFEVIYLSPFNDITSGGISGLSIYRLVMESGKTTLPDYLVWFYDYKILIFLIVGFSLLLNAPVEMLALKFKTFGWKGNEIRYSFLALTLVIIFATMFISSVVIAVPIIILLYIVISLLNNAFKKTKNEI